MNFFTIEEFSLERKFTINLDEVLYIRAKGVRGENKTVTIYWKNGGEVQLYPLESSYKRLIKFLITNN